MKLLPVQMFFLFLSLTLMLPQVWADSEQSPAPAADPSVPAKQDPYWNLSPEDREVLDRGEVGAGQYIAGGIVGTFVGLGIGQAIQGRYLPTGLIITVGETAGLGMLIAGTTQCVVNTIGTLGTQNTQDCNSSLLSVGLGVYLGFHLWEIIDVWATPPSINHRYRQLKDHLDRTTSFGVIPATASGQSQIDGAQLAYQFRF
jgi:hypothetical protein